MIRVYKIEGQAVIWHEHSYYSLSVRDWDEFLNRHPLYQHLLQDLKTRPRADVNKDFLDGVLDAPMGSQEVWAAGVTYLRSKEARMDEARVSGGDVFYDKVYEARRPELFFKATPYRTVGHGHAVHIRRDSTWDVPEPELTLFINSRGAISGYTIGNDMSSRSIEGENPLYLPQAKIYDRSAALGPCLLVLNGAIDPNTRMELQIHREGTLKYKDAVSINRMKRTHQELVDYLWMECSFPRGVFLMTGTCLVPPAQFSLKENDVISITIDNIGTLVNPVGRFAS